MSFNFDDTRTYFLQVLRDCRQITFVTLNGFWPLSKKTTPLFQNGQYQDGQNTNQNFFRCALSFEGTSCKNLKDTVTRSSLSWCFY